MCTHFKAEETNKLAFVEKIYSNVLSFQAWHDLVMRKNKTKWGDRDIEMPATTEHDEHETDFKFNSNVLVTQLGGVSNGSRGEKCINAPEFQVVEQPPSPHNPPGLQKMGNDLKWHLDKISQSVFRCYIGLTHNW
jgi:hypothetical protein